MFPEHRILITINKLPIFLIDFDSIDFFDLIDFLVLNQLIFVLIFLFGILILGVETFDPFFGGCQLFWLSAVGKKI